MVKSIILILAFLCLFANSALAITLPLIGNSGWYYPTGTSSLGNYRSFGVYVSDGNFSGYHLGKDVSASRGDSVYAIGDGVVEKASMSVGGYKYSGGQLSSGGAMLIKHTSESGDSFYVLYGHLQNLQYSAGDTVKAGRQIAEIGQWDGAEHLHFAVNTDQAIWTGYAPSSGDYFGFVNPFVFLSNNSAPIASSVPYFDGAGSLVDPTKSGNCGVHNNFGCSRDTVRLHPHPNQNSAGFFQVLHMPGVCEAIQLTGLTYADVEARAWDGRGEGSKYYEVDALPAVINLMPNVQWNLVAVQSVSPVPENSFRDVTATCLPGPLSDPNVRQVTGNPLGFDSSYMWGGNGSLISFSNNKTYSDSNYGFGRSIDTVVLLNGQKTLSAFQVAPESCRTVTFSTPVGLEVTWKPWDHTWGSSATGSAIVSNGGSVVLSTNYPYWVIKVKPVGSAVNGEVTARCGG